MHHSSAQRNVDDVAAEQIGDADAQDRGFPSLRRIEKLRPSEDDDQRHGKRNDRSHAVDDADEPKPPGHLQRKWNRHQLERQKHKGEPGEIEPQPLGREPAKGIPVPPIEEDDDLSHCQSQCKKDTQRAYRKVMNLHCRNLL